MINGFKKVKSWQHFNLGSVWFELPVLWSLSKNYTRHQSVLTILCIDTKLFTPLKYLRNVCLFTTETRYSEAIPPIRVSTLVQNIRDPLHVCLLLVALYAYRCPTNGLSYCFIAHNAFVSTTIFPTLTTGSHTVTLIACLKFLNTICSLHREKQLYPTQKCIQFLFPP